MVKAQHFDIPTSFGSSLPVAAGYGRHRLVSAVCMAALMASFATPGRAADTSSGLEEVVINAQKREERAQDIPISIGVMTGQDLADKGIVNIDDLGGQLPNVQVVLPFGPQAPQFSVRGVTQTDFSGNQSSPIALYVDGVFKSVGALQALNMFDTDTLAVERGPQGTLQGRNATGGAVLINTIKPTFDTDGYLTVGVGDYGRLETQGAFNTPLIDGKLAMRIAYMYTNVDGYIKDSEPGVSNSSLSGVNDGAVRVSFLYKDDDFDAVLRLSKSRSNPTNYGAYAKDIGPGGEGIPSGSLAYLNIPQSEYGPTGYTRAGLGFFDTNSNYVHSRLLENQGISLEMNKQLTPDLKLTSVSGLDNGSWRTNEDDAGAPYDIDHALYTSRVTSVQEELRLTSSFAGPENFIFGALYGYEQLYFSNQSDWDQYVPAILNDANGVPVNVCLATQFFTCSTKISLNQQREDLAAYVNNTYKITDNLNFTVGTRYTDDSVKVSNYSASLDWINPTTGVNVPPIVTLPSTSAQTGDHKWIGKAGLDYHFDPDHMVYGTWSLGFRGSAFNASATAPGEVNAVKPETLTDYEVGTKNDFFDHRLRLNLDGFYYVYRNQQFASIDPANDLSVEYNLPKIDSTGGEMEITLKPLNDLVVNMTAGYTYAVYRSGLVFDTPVVGNRVQDAPRWSFTGSVDWHFLDTSWAAFDWLFNGRGLTSQYFDPYNDSLSKEGPYAIFDTKISADLPGLNSTATLWVQNLFNREYYTAIYPAQSSLNYSEAFRGNPRTFGATYSWQF